ncbi:MAG: hypothetical protein AMXMBFR37_11520 [Steroidobacteraceae bacterium]
MSRERGHAVAFVLALLGCLVVATLLVHESGRLAAQKRRLVDSADAAALSAAQFEARVLNLESYLNRAIVADQAAMAQSVSLRSWLDHMTRTVSRVDQVARYVPYLAAATRTLRGLMQGTNRIAQPVLTAGEGALALYTSEFALAGEALHLAAAPAAVDLARRSASANAGAALSPRGEALLAAHVARWSGHTRRYAGAARTRQQDLIERSLDRFTTDRGATLANLAIVKLEKRGGTDLLGFDTWRGMDTFALHRRDLFGWHESLSIGWGAAEQGAATAARGRHGNSYRVNRHTSRAAMRDLRSSRLSRGLPALRDIADTGARDTSLRLDLEFEVAPAPAVLPLPGAARNGDAARMLALSSARVFHERPARRADGRRELGSLYSPYWQARLATPPWPVLP